MRRLGRRNNFENEIVGTVGGWHRREYPRSARRRPAMRQTTTLIQRYFTEPYRFVAPHRGKIWCHVSRFLMPRHLRRRMEVTRVSYQGIDLLRRSMEQGAGVMLCPNHCRDADPIVVGMTGLQVRSYLYYVVSSHLFRQSRFLGWWINRIGGFSIWREGADREAI